MNSNAATYYYYDGWNLIQEGPNASVADRTYVHGGRVDVRGNLVISGIEPGTYDLGIQCDGTRVWIRGVSV